MYENLLREMAAAGVTVDDLAKFLGRHRNTISERIKSGKFPIADAFKVKKEFFQSYGLEYLFKRFEKNDNGKA